jgi:hypothetical protein
MREIITYVNKSTFLFSKKRMFGEVYEQESHLRISPSDLISKTSSDVN